MLYRLVFILFLFSAFTPDTNLKNLNSELVSGSKDSSILKIKKSPDFKVTGDGCAENWKRTQWVEITQRRFSNDKQPRTTKVKILYSETGIYFLFNCADKKISASMNADFLDLWKQDVVEVFLWPDESTSTYFEYEISPLNFELPIIISNDNGDLVRWQPFHYDEDRRTMHATSVLGGEKKSDATIASWTAEFFIPYKLLRPLKNIYPKSGSKWRANIYRVDYDNGTSSWSWQLTAKSFHDYEKFGFFEFE